MPNISFELGICPVATIESRLAKRKNLSEDKCKRLISFSPQRRQNYTIRTIVEHQEVWTRWEGDELPMFESSQNAIVHIWPHQELASQFNDDKLESPKCVPIPLNDWIDEILFVDDSKMDVGYFPIDMKKPVMMSSKEEFLYLLLDEWEYKYSLSNAKTSVAELLKSREI